jgi:hypothetical protein
MTLQCVTDNGYQFTLQLESSEPKPDVTIFVDTDKHMVRCAPDATASLLCEALMAVSRPLPTRVRIVGSVS